VKFERSSGILLHPTSLPGPYGIGDLGPKAVRFVEFLAASGCKLWQVLPLGPTGFGDSPYQCFSAMAGNPYLISPELLLKQGLLVPDDLANMPAWSSKNVDFGALYRWKPGLLAKAYTRFESLPDVALRVEFDAFRFENAAWLEDFALFMALKESNAGVSWNKWPEPLRNREKQALEAARKSLASTILRFMFLQFLFFRQWNDIRNLAHKKGIKIIGDIPIFVAMDSADVWAHPELFYLDEAGQPTVVAGVPPDYFSPTGQLWGNPLYRWDVHKQTGYQWWIERIRATLKTVDIIRIDHFLGFSAYWKIPGTAKTAEKGRWSRGPGADFLKAIRKALVLDGVVSAVDDLPLIAEDLGLITPAVIKLRDSFNLPGMKILQFAFSGPDNIFLPHHYTRRCVVYTGTHDNDTTLGWYDTASPESKDYARRYLAVSGANIGWNLIRAAWSSVAVFSLAPMQDFLKLGTKARMNFPGKLGGNWSWRMDENALTESLKQKIQELNGLYQR
jgi:4-alpha-glucanotransferase